MRILNGEEARKAQEYVETAVQEAKLSPCFRAQCGSVVVKDGVILGKGFNSPPQNEKLKKCLKDDLPTNFKSDKTCCIHAEDRAVRDALINHSEKVKGATLYFIRLKDGKPAESRDPYCTMCSKMSYDVGLHEFVLLHQEGYCAYNLKEYNDLSFKHRV